MGIKVTYNPVAALGMGALHAGYGQYNARKDAEAQRWNMMLAQIEAQRSADAERMAHAAEQAHYQRIFQADRDKFLANNQFERDQFQAGTQADRDQFLAGNQIDRDKFRADKDFEILQKKYDFDRMEYTDKQKDFLERVDADIADVEMSDDWTPEKKSEIIEDLRRKKMNLPPAKRKEPLPEPITEEYIGKNFKKLDNGWGVFIGPDGKPHYMPPEKTEKDSFRLSPKDLAELENKAIERLTVEEKYTTPNGEKDVRVTRPTQAQVDAEVERLILRQQALFQSKGVIQREAPSQEPQPTQDELGQAAAEAVIGAWNGNATPAAPPTPDVNPAVEAVKNADQAWSTMPPEAKAQIGSVATELANEIRAAKQRGDTKALEVLLKKAEQLMVDTGVKQ